MEFRVGKWYTKKQMQKFMSNADLRETVKVQGGIMQYEPTTQRVRITSYKDAAHAPELGRVLNESGRAWTSQKVMDDLTEGIPGVRKRTPQERMDSMMKRLAEHYRQTGRTPTKADAEIQAMVGEFHRHGVGDVDGEFLRKVAQHFLEQARREQMKNDHRKIVSTPGNDRVPNVG